MSTNVNVIAPVGNGGTQIKSSKGFSSASSPVSSAKLNSLLEGSGKAFSQTLKEVSNENPPISASPKPGEAGLQPVKPKYEKQGCVNKPSAKTNNSSYSAANSPSQSEVNNAGNAADVSPNNANSGLSVNQANIDAGAAQSNEQLFNAFGAAQNGEEAILDNMTEGVDNQSLLLQLQGVFAPNVNLNLNFDNEQEGLLQGENDEISLVPVVDTDLDLTADEGLLQGENDEISLVPTVDTDLDLTEDFVKTSDAASNVLLNGLNAENAKETDLRETVNISDGSQHNLKENDSQNVNGAASAVLTNQESLELGNAITFTVTDNGIFIGGEGDSVEDASNLVDGDFLQRLSEALGIKLENVDKPTVGEQLKQLLTMAIQMAAADMNDPVKQQEEYQQKLLEFLMKFVDKINGKDDDDSDDDKNQGDILLRLIENLIDETESGSDSDDEKNHIAAVYASVLGAGYLNAYQTDDNAVGNKIGEEDAETEPVDIIDPVERAVDAEVFNNTALVNFENKNDAYSDNIAVDGNSVPAAAKAVNTADNGRAENVMENTAAANANAEINNNYFNASFADNSDIEESSAKKDSSIPVNLQFKHNVKGASDELKELERLFGINKNHDEEKMKEMNELASDSNEEDNQGNFLKGKPENELEKGLGKVAEKSLIESVTLEAVKVETAPVARGYVPDENGIKQIAAQIMTEMLNNLDQTDRTVTTFTMTLNPENLGRLTMRVSEEAGKISVLITAHNKETAEILSQRMDAVQQAAKDNGTQLEKYQVVYGAEQDSRAGQQNYDGSSKNPYVRQDNEETQKDNADGSQFADFLKNAV